MPSLSLSPESDAQSVSHLRQDLAAAQAEIAALRAAAATVAPRLLEFERLRRDMRWEAAPRALRWLLPVARLLHRPGPEPALAPEPTLPAPASDVAPVAPLAGTSRMRGSVLAAYRLVRPVVRPVAWRSRSFLTGELMRELADVRAKLDLALQRLPPDGRFQDRAALSPGAGRAAERMLLTLALESRRD